MTQANIDRLLFELLDRQDEDGRGADLSEERLREVLREGKLLCDDEKYLLATSPLARANYVAVEETLRVEREAKRRGWQQAGIQTETRLLAASSDSDPLVIAGGDFSVTVRRHPTSDGWLVTLALGDKFLRNIGPEDIISLVDDQGNVWVRGRPSVYGQVHAYEWPYPGSPASETRRTGFSLRVEGN
ncbi:MAG: hypothetical protein H6872_09320 [Methylobacteriaceae bacterium]|nr:hypothetical protein [Rhodoblastus sp.]MCC0005325.1 hypothetical protein [Methylobacteriaceae bacterium]